MEKLQEFVRAVFSHWEPLMSGVLATFFLWVLSSLYEQRHSSGGLPWYIYAFTASIFLFYACYRAWLEKDADISQRDEKITQLTIENLRLTTGEPTDSVPSVFEIEYLEHQQLWREGNERESFPVLAGLPLPRNATRVLQVRLRISAIPGKVVEDIQLNVANSRIYLRAGDWPPRLIDYCEPTLCFDIPSHIELTHHTIQLIAECEKGTEKKSAVFRVLPLQSSVR